MLAFKEYLIEEYKTQAKQYAAVEFKFTHSTNVKTDKRSGCVLKNDIVKVAVRFVDKDMNTLFSGNIAFVNNVIEKKKEKCLINISPKELNNKFAFAKREILETIMNEYCEKRDELNRKINSLQSYYGNDGDIIDRRVKGESIRIVDVNSQTNESNNGECLNESQLKKKVKFDM